MRIINRNSFNKKLLIILLCVLLTAGVIVVILFMTSGSENKRLTQEIDNTSSVQEDQVKPESTDADINSNLPDKNSGSTGTFEPDPTTPTPETSPEKANILRAEATGTAVKVVATFQGASSGYCELAMINGSNTVSRNAQIVVGPNYYSCSFSLPLSEVQSGSWTTTVNHKIGSASSSSDTRVIEVN